MLRQLNNRIISPRTEHDNGKFWRLMLGQILLRDLAQMMCDTSTQDRTLAHTTGSVEQGKS